MKGNIIIRHARDKDLKRILKLVCELIEVIKNNDGIELSFVPDNLKKTFKNDNSHFLVAEENGEITGFVHFSIRLTILHRGPTAVVEEITVKKEKRRSGIGEKLLAGVIENCGKIGCSEIEVNTGGGNEEALNFYEKMGFKNGGRLFEYHME